MWLVTSQITNKYTISFQGLIFIVLLGVGVATPAKLLRVPKIYNALITSKEKILPSEAFPGTTGPLFQPIGLPGQPLLIHPEIIGGKKLSDVKEGDEVKLPYHDSKSSKVPQPLTFFPRYSLYYANQPHLILQHLYAPLELTGSPQPVGNSQTHVDRDLEREELKDLSVQKNKQEGRVSSPVPSDTPKEYFKNNRPANKNIPDIPPPPPPIRYRNIEEAEKFDVIRNSKRVDLYGGD